MPIPSREARRRLEQEVAAADAVIVHDALYVSSILAARYASKHRKPWVLVQHIGTIPFSSRPLRWVMALANRLVTRPLLMHAPQAIFISDAVRRFFGDMHWQVPPMLLLNGVDHQTFRSGMPKERGALRKRFGFTDDRRQLLFVGRFVEKKGLTILREMASRRPDWNFWLAGSGPIDPSEWGLPNVRLLGRKSRGELAELYRAADALILPSVGEGFPLVVQEAMASALPVFCGLDTGEADPAARDLLHAIEVDHARPSSTAVKFAAAIEASKPGPDTTLARHARENYDWDRNALQLLESFDAMMRTGVAPRASKLSPPAVNKSVAAAPTA